MAGTAIRDPFADHLLTAQNAAMFLIDYQPSRLAAVCSMDPKVGRIDMGERTWSAAKPAQPMGDPP